MKVLIIRFSSIGDIVLTTPVIRCLKKQLPNVEVHYLTKKVFKPVLQNNPYIDKLILLEDNLDDILASLKEENYSLVIDLHHNLRTLRIKKALKVPAKSFNKLNIQKWIYTSLKINILPKVHIVDRYLDTLKHLNIQNDGQGLDYFIAEHEHISENDIPVQHSFGYIGIVIGAALNTKKLPVTSLKKLCQQIDFPIILLGGSEDAEAGKEIASIDEVKIYNACGKFSLNESAHLVSKANLVISHDTGLMHIAAAFKKPIISIWGNTTPSFGMTPYYGRVNIANVIHQVNNLFCRPCSKIGYKKCPRLHFKCMNSQNLGKIVDDVTLFQKK